MPVSRVAIPAIMVNTTKGLVPSQCLFNAGKQSDHDSCSDEQQCAVSSTFLQGQSCHMYITKGFRLDSVADNVRSRTCIQLVNRSHLCRQMRTQRWIYIYISKKMSCRCDGRNHPAHELYHTGKPDKAASPFRGIRENASSSGHFSQVNLFSFTVAKKPSM